MEGNKVVQGALEEGGKRSFPEKRKAQESLAAAAASSPAAILAFLARPLSLLRHVAHGCAGYLGGLASRLKPAAAAAACQPQQEEGTVEAAAVVTEEEVVVVQVRSRGLKEGRGGSGGAHHK